jgi:CelD/BcsL family acetyltransferase involved in cellulose biosynthesis
MLDAGLPESADEAPTDGIEYRVATTAAELEALGGEWQALERRSHGAIFFQSWAWCAHVVRILAAEADRPALQAAVATAWRGETLVALWPMRVRTTMGARILCDLTDPFGQYADVVVDDEASVAPATLLARMLERAVAETGASGATFRKVRADSRLGHFLARRAGPMGETQLAPFVSMAGYGDFESYHATLKSKTRKNLRNARHRLERQGSVRHVALRRDPAMAAQLEQCLALRLDWLKERAQTSSAFNDPAFLPLLRKLSDTKSHGIDVMCMSLTVEDTPVSVHFGFAFGGRYYAYMAARNPVFDDCSPGKLHLEHVLRSCHAAGLGTADLLAPMMPYKLTWASGTVPVTDYGMAFDWRGQAVVGLWHGTLRTVGRRAFNALPERIRRPVAEILRRSAWAGQDAGSSWSATCAR